MKKGLSSVISMVLLIFIAIAALFLIFVVVRPFITNSSSKISGQEAILSNSLQVSSLVKDEGNNRISFNLRRNAGSTGELSAFIFKIEDEAGKTYNIRQNISLNELESKAITLDYFSAGLGKLKKVSVYPILVVDSKELISSIPTTVMLDRETAGSASGKIINAEVVRYVQGSLQVGQELNVTISISSNQNVIGIKEGEPGYWKINESKQDVDQSYYYSLFNNETNEWLIMDPYVEINTNLTYAVIPEQDHLTGYYYVSDGSVTYERAITGDLAS